MPNQNPKDNLEDELRKLLREAEQSSDETNQVYISRTTSELLSSMLEKNQVSIEEPPQLKEARELIEKGNVPLKRPLFKRQLKELLGFYYTTYDKAREKLRELRDRYPSRTDGQPSNRFMVEADVLELLMDYHTAFADKEWGKAEKVLDSILDIAERNKGMPVKQYVLVEKAKVYFNQGSFDEAHNTLTDSQVRQNDESVLFLMGLIELSQSDYKTAEKKLRKVYDKNPKREGIGKKLISAYTNLAKLAQDPTTDYSSVNNATREKWEEGVNRYREGSIRIAEAKFKEVIDAIDESARVARATVLSDAQKSLKARSLHYLANISRVRSDYTSAISYLRESIAVLPTPKAYTCLAETHEKCQKT